MQRSWIIGAADACDMQARSPFVSGQHCRLEVDERGWAVTDLGSTNGTFVNGTRIRGKSRVSRSDRVTLGRTFPLPWPEIATQPEPPRQAPPTVRPGSGDDRTRIRRDGVVVSDVSIDVNGRRLLSDVSISVEPGELVGIMGPSGAGKSTLLAAIVGTQGPTSGAVRVCGRDVHHDRGSARGMIGFVPQDDIMHTDLTVSQALWFSARLRLPPSLTNAEIHDRVSRVIAQLGLQGIENTRIGSAERRGISGGQRKRVNVALELLTDPPVLVLDEPTSGLSSAEALAMMSLLRQLADGGKTVMLTIHQPGSESLRLFDAVAVIAKDSSTNDAGVLVWYGPPLPDATEFFEPSAGREADGDAILRGLVSRPAAAWRTSFRATRSHQHWIVHRRHLALDAVEHVGGEAAPPTHALHQWAVLTGRALAVKLADRWNTGILLLQAPFIAALIALIFGDKARGALDAANWGVVTSALSITTFLQALAAVWLGCSNAARELVAERAIYVRERMVGISPVAYLCSKLAVLSALCLVQCAALLMLTRLGCGLQGSGSYAFLLLLLAAETGVGLGLLISAFVRTAEAAAAALPVVIMPMVILGGSLLPLPELPPLAADAANLASTRWGFEGLLVNEAESREPLRLPDPARPGQFIEQDLAERWFPEREWRSNRHAPAIALAMIWLASLVPLFARYVDDEPGG